MFHECSDKEPILAIPISPACQDAVVPFPWSKSSGPRKLSEKVGPVGHDDAESSRPTKVLRSTALKLDDFPWYSDLARPCQELGCIRFQVPKSGSSAGSVLRHSQSIMESIFRVHDPCIFKIGWTHCPAWRWSNKLYGYAGDRDGWSDMVVLFVSHEPYSPAMLEAALIDKHFSDSALLIANLCRAGRKLVFFCPGCLFQHLSKMKNIFIEKTKPPGPHSPGRPGCRNVKQGGDNAIPPSTTSEGWYATYVVYRSFKYPPPIPKLEKLARGGA